MSDNKFIKFDEQWIHIKRSPISFAIIACLAVFTLSIAVAIVKMPDEWRGKVMPKIEQMIFDQKKRDADQDSMSADTAHKLERLQIGYEDTLKDLREAQKDVATLRSREAINKEDIRALREQFETMRSKAKKKR